jgi:hypothetical protein
MPYFFPTILDFSLYRGKTGKSGSAWDMLLEPVFRILAMVNHVVGEEGYQEQDEGAREDGVYDEPGGGLSLHSDKGG